MNIHKLCNYLALCSLSLGIQVACAEQISTNPPATAEDNALNQRISDETAVINNPFAISFYQPNYILPYFYTEMPDAAIYQNTLPVNQQLSSYELKFQFSVKYPLWKINSRHVLYLGYTQQSFWQAYENSPFFRETDYMPEIFLSNEENWHLVDGWQTNFFNAGLAHQSNGHGGDLERSWNRAYVDAISSKGNWLTSIKPWYIFHDSSMEDHNSDIAHYMGYGEVVAGYKYGNQVFSVMLRNEVESGLSRGSEQFTWSFPLWDNFKGYVYAFSGYGQSLIEYNHYTNSYGLGFNLSDWI